MRLTSSLAALLPGVTAFDLSRSSRVSKETLPLYLPLVWHSAQRALRMGAMSWAKSIFFGSPAKIGVAGTMKNKALMNGFIN